MPPACCPPPAGSPAVPLEDEDAAGIARALAHPVRIRILRTLQSRDGCYCGDLCDDLPLAQSTVSQHLKILKEARLVRGTRSGTSVCYCVEPGRLDAYRSWIEALAATPSAAR